MEHAHYTQTHRHKTLRNAVEPSTLAVFSHVQAVGVAHGSEPVAVDGAQSSMQTFQHHPPAPHWTLPSGPGDGRRMGGLAAATGACVWV